MITDLLLYSLVRVRKHEAPSNDGEEGFPNLTNILQTMINDGFLNSVEDAVLFFTAFEKSV